MKRRPALFVSVRPPSEAKSTVDSYQRVFQTVFGTSVRPRYKDWTRSNLRTSVLRRAGRKLTNAFFDVTEQSGIALIWISVTDRLPLSTFLDWLDQARCPGGIVYLRVPNATALMTIEGQIPSFNRITFVLLFADDLMFCLALACEATNWQGLASAKGDIVSYSHLTRCVLRTLAAYKDLHRSSMFSYRVLRGGLENGRIAWTGGLRFGKADIDKFLQHARDEQTSDTLKRIFDDACSPRSNHRPVSDRLVCSQGLFWLSEVADEADASDWLAHTTLYEEVSGRPARVLKQCVPAFTGGSDVLLRAIMDAFVPVPGAVYQLGSNQDFRESEPAAPPRSSYVHDFRILRYLVTEDLWNAMLNGYGEIEPRHALPITSVTYFDALAFARVVEFGLVQLKLIDADRHAITLPSEDQWEAAARGWDSRDYPWGNQFALDHANCDYVNTGPTPVGSFSPRGDSPFGCSDMAGNLREWTRSIVYAPTGIEYPNGKPDSDLLTGDRVIIRGGSYSYDFLCVRTWVRNTQLPSRSDAQTGFRLVIEERQR